MDKSSEQPVCKYCGQPMKKWATPSLTNWETEWFWVCFNDDCSYFRKGWDWMMAKFSVNSSYRYRIDPSSGEDGPLPVWSEHALKSNIIEENNHG